MATAKDKEPDDLDGVADDVSPTEEFEYAPADAGDAGVDFDDKRAAGKARKGTDSEEVVVEIGKKRKPNQK